MISYLSDSLWPDMDPEAIGAEDLVDFSVPPDFTDDPS